jgi:hypothetical protein
MIPAITGINFIKQELDKYDKWIEKSTAFNVQFEGSNKRSELLDEIRDIVNGVLE